MSQPTAKRSNMLSPKTEQWEHRRELLKRDLIELSVNDPEAEEKKEVEEGVQLYEEERKKLASASASAGSSEPAANTANVRLPPSPDELKLIRHVHVCRSGGPVCVHQQELKALLSTPGFNINVQSHLMADQTALMHAAHAGNPEVVALLIAAGANINITGHMGWTALMWSAVAANKYYSFQPPYYLHADRFLLFSKGKHAKVAQMLLDAKADPWVRDENQQTALTPAVASGSPELLKLFLDRQPSEALLNDALLYGISTMREYWVGTVLKDELKCLMAAKADINVKTAEGQTVLMAVVRRDAPELVRAILECRAPINEVDHAGKTALMYCTDRMFSYGQTPCTNAMKVLLEARADPNVQDARGETALMKAARAGIVEQVQLLLNHNADTELRDKTGRRVFEIANDATTATLRAFSSRNCTWLRDSVTCSIQ